MVYLLVSFVAAFAVAFSTFNATGSILMAFLAYSGTGALVLLTAFLAHALALRAEEKDDRRTA